MERRRQTRESQQLLEEIFSSLLFFSLGFSPAKECFSPGMYSTAVADGPERSTGCLADKESKQMLCEVTNRLCCVKNPELHLKQERSPGLFSSYSRVSKSTENELSAKERKQGMTEESTYPKSSREYMSL